jgi:hypothetical protein
MPQVRSLRHHRGNRRKNIEGLRAIAGLIAVSLPRVWQAPWWRWPHNAALGGRSDCIQQAPGLGGIKHLRPVIAPVADGRVGGLHNHLVRVVGMEKIERRARVASVVVDA